MIKENPDVCKTSKADRRKKLAKFQDKMHNIWGTHIMRGIGNGTPNICDNCKTRVYKTTGYYVGSKVISLCEDCKGKVDLTNFV